MGKLTDYKPLAFSHNQIDLNLTTLLIFYRRNVGTYILYMNI